MEKLKDISEMKHTLIEAARTQLAQGIESVDTEEMGQVIDMIKDLASAEKSCMEAAYYELVCEAMDGGESERMGYDRWRYSSGRFAPKGRGHVSGYLPTGDDVLDARPMGYDRRTERRDGRYGYTPDRYVTERMGMHDGMTSKERMDKAIDVMGDIWADATMDERKVLKACVEDLLHQMEQA